jgi:cytochrome c553
MKGRALLAAALACAAGAHAQDAAAGKAKAAACAMCHGPVGIAAAPDTPNLAGQPASYIEEQLKAYRGGTRKHEVMSLMARPLTDADIANLAAWFSAIKVEATAPR